MLLWLGPALISWRLRTEQEEIRQEMETDSEDLAVARKS